MGAGELLVTSMDRDGSKSGYDLGLIGEISKRVSVPVIASGGAGSAADMVEAIVTGCADAVLAASIFHFGETTIVAVKSAMAAAGIPVRLTAGVVAK